MLRIQVTKFLLNNDYSTQFIIILSAAVEWKATTTLTRTKHLAYKTFFCYILIRKISIEIWSNNKKSMFPDRRVIYLFPTFVLDVPQNDARLADGHQSAKVIRLEGREVNSLCVKVGSMQQCGRCRDLGKTNE
jgi:hypothetical protein